MNKSKYPIFFVALPKSASSYITDSLYKNFDIRCYPDIDGGDSFNFLLNRNKLIESKKYKYFTSSHCSPIYENFRMIEEYLVKIHIHVREPRQALVSFFYNIERNQIEKPHLNKPLKLCKDYFSLDEMIKKKYLIDRYFPQIVKWINDWYQFQFTAKTKILYTTFEEFKENEKNFHLNMLNFFEFDYGNFRYSSIKTNETHLFRKGENFEWNDFFDLNQKRDMRKILDKKIYEYFKWDL